MPRIESTSLCGLLGGAVPLSSDFMGWKDIWRETAPMIWFNGAKAGMDCSDKGKVRAFPPSSNSRTLMFECLAISAAIRLPAVPAPTTIISKVKSMALSSASVMILCSGWRRNSGRKTLTRSTKIALAIKVRVEVVEEGIFPMYLKMPFVYRASSTPVVQKHLIVIVEMTYRAL